LLAIYLNDHLAGATVGRELARRTAAANRNTPYAPFLERLAVEVAEDRRSLLQVMRSLDVRIDRLKVAAGWSAEKLGRLKFNGQLKGYSPLSRVVELEGMTLGVIGKLAVWRSLEHLETAQVVRQSVDLPGLIARAEQQLRELEEHRLRAVAEGLSAN
jgi:hypothetical protein